MYSLVSASVASCDPWFTHVLLSFPEWEFDVKVQQKCTCTGKHLPAHCTVTHWPSKPDPPPWPNPYHVTDWSTFTSHFPPPSRINLRSYIMPCVSLLLYMWWFVTFHLTPPPAFLPLPPCPSLLPSSHPSHPPAPFLLSCRSHGCRQRTVPCGGASRLGEQPAMGQGDLVEEEEVEGEEATGKGVWFVEE